MKRIIRFLIAAVLFLSTVPASVFATDLNEGDSLSIASISAKINETDAKVTVRAEDTELGVYKLCIAVYSDGQEKNRASASFSGLGNEKDAYQIWGGTYDSSTS